jgi:hypothetical protein
MVAAAGWWVGGCGSSTRRPCSRTWARQYPHIGVPRWCETCGPPIALVTPAATTCWWATIAPTLLLLLLRRRTLLLRPPRLAGLAAAAAAASTTAARGWLRGVVDACGAGDHAHVAVGAAAAVAIATGCCPGGPWHHLNYAVPVSCCSCACRRTICRWLPCGRLLAGAACGRGWTALLLISHVQGQLVRCTPRA